MNAQPIIEIRNLGKFYDGFEALSNVNLSIAPGERIVICGPSGSGKSTLIRCINRLEEHSTGDLFVDGIELSEDTKDIRACARRLAWCSSSSTSFPT